MGILYVVSTPIGNLEDITIRAVRLLLEAKVVVCEDTRRTGLLVNLLRERYGRFVDSLNADGRQYVSVRDWNEAKMVNRVVELLSGYDVVLVSDAGTPLISDPGFKVVRAVIDAGYLVLPVPGPSAAIAALSVGGLAADKWEFMGFLPKKWDLPMDKTVVIFESAKRIRKTLSEINVRYPRAMVVVVCEMTKMFEKFFRGKAAEVAAVMGKENLKGEMTILVRDCAPSC